MGIFLRYQVILRCLKCLLSFRKGDKPFDESLVIKIVF